MTKYQIENRLLNTRYELDQFTEAHDKLCERKYLNKKDIDILNYAIRNKRNSQVLVQEIIKYQDLLTQQ